MSTSSGTETLHITEQEREAALARLRETFGSPPPEDLLRLARERAQIEPSEQPHS